MARNNSRFNRLLNFIGLVDESDDRDYGYDDGRPRGAATYTPSGNSRNPAPQSARPMRAQDESDARYQSRGGYRDERYDAPPQRYADADRERRDQRDGNYSNSRYASTPPRRQPDYEQRAPRQDYARRDPYQGQPRSGSAPRSSATPPRQSAPHYDDYPPQDVPRDYSQPRQMPQNRDDAPPDNVVRLRDSGRSSATVIFYLHRLEECRDVIIALLDGKSVFLNLEDMDERLLQRGIDTLSGAAFALQAKLEKTSDKTFLVAPSSVTVENSKSEDVY